MANQAGDRPILAFCLFLELSELLRVDPEWVRFAAHGLNVADCGTLSSTKSTAPLVTSATSVMLPLSESIELGQILIIH